MAMAMISEASASDVRLASSGCLGGETWRKLGEPVRHGTIGSREEGLRGLSVTRTAKPIEKTGTAFPQLFRAWFDHLPCLKRRWNRKKNFGFRFCYSISSKLLKWKGRFDVHTSIQVNNLSLKSENFDLWQSTFQSAIFHPSSLTFECSAIFSQCPISSLRII